MATNRPPTTAPTTTLLGYARVSTADQSIGMQTDALEAAGCWRVWSDVSSGSTTSRPALDECLAALRPGDSLVVWRLDRLGRSLPHLIETVRTLESKGVQFRSLTEAIDTSTPAGRLMVSIFASLAEFERDLIRERTMAGLAAARARGRVGGRKTVMTTPKVAGAKKLLAAGTTITTTAQALGVSRAALYRFISTHPDVKP